MTDGYDFVLHLVTILIDEDDFQGGGGITLLELTTAATTPTSIEASLKEKYFMQSWQFNVAENGMEIYLGIKDFTGKNC